MIKLNKDFSFERDSYGWKLHQKHITNKRDGTGEGERCSTYFYANLEQMAKCILVECSDVDGNIDDMINAWHHCINEIKTALESKI